MRVDGIDMRDREMERKLRPGTTSRAGRELFSVVLRHWPSVLALGLALLIWPTGAESTVRVLAGILLIMPLIYLLTAATGRQAATWPVFGALGVVFVLSGLQDAAPGFVIPVMLAVLVCGWAVATGRFDRAFLVPVAGMVVFGAIAIAAQYVELNIAHYLVAGGWIAHGVWDFAHHRADRTVARSFAEFCGVVDVLVGGVLLIAA
ncbi:hypothetical protein [Nocardia crassostreae]|uniref:hypothetical protein n=1 Tax=Nocardia crassostreae TaxID=53428 RepID=UPI0012F7844B|nr:hypothetical protein [Nocardia crassostreae]